MPETDFACSVCGGVCATVRLRESSGGTSEIWCSGFIGEAGYFDLPADRIPALRQAIEARDAKTLHSVDPLYAPFYCRSCDTNYCARHWEKTDIYDDDHPSWYDSTRGRCPKGHLQKLAD